MKKFNFFALTLATVLAFGTTGCTKEDPNETAGYPSLELTATNSLTIQTQKHDTTAAYALNFTISLDGGYLVVKGGTSSPDVSLNLPATTVCPTATSVADYGEVDELANVENYPDTSEFKSKILCEEGHGYVVEAHGAANLSAYGNPAIHDPAKLYVRIYVSEATDNGFKIYYQYPFIP